MSNRPVPFTEPFKNTSSIRPKKEFMDWKPNCIKVRRALFGLSQPGLAHTIFFLSSGRSTTSTRKRESETSRTDGSSESAFIQGLARIKDGERRVEQDGHAEKTGEPVIQKPRRRRRLTKEAFGQLLLKQPLGNPMDLQDAVNGQLLFEGEDEMHGQERAVAGVSVP